MMKMFNLLTLSILFLSQVPEINATTIYGVPSAIQLKFLPLQNISISKQTSFDFTKQIAAQKWGIPPTSIYGYIYNGKVKRNPTEQEWKADLPEILAKKQDVYLITNPPSL